MSDRYTETVHWNTERLVLSKPRNVKLPQQNFLDTHLLGTIKFIGQVGLECKERVKKGKEIWKYEIILIN